MRVPCTRWRNLQRSMSSASKAYKPSIKEEANHCGENCPKKAIARRKSPPKNAAFVQFCRPCLKIQPRPNTPENHGRNVKELSPTNQLSFRSEAEADDAAELRTDCCLWIRKDFLRIHRRQLDRSALAPADFAVKPQNLRLKNSAVELLKRQ